MSSPKILYILACHHVMPGNATPMPDGIQCGICQSWQSIRGVHVYEWRAWCETKTCSFARFTGLSQVLAKQQATQHWRQHGSHDLKVGYRINPVAKRRQDVLERNGVI